MSRKQESLMSSRIILSFRSMNTDRVKAILFMVVLIMASCSKNVSDSYRSHLRSGAIATKDKTKTNDNQLRNQIIQEAGQYIGVKYKYGGKTPKGFDCSGFTTFIMDKMNVAISGPSYAQAKLGKNVPLDKAQPGDLIFFSRGKKVFHVGIVYENKKNELWIIHSSSSKGVIKEEILSSDYWKKKIYGVRNYIDI